MEVYHVYRFIRDPDHGDLRNIYNISRIYIYIYHINQYIKYQLSTERERVDIIIVFVSFSINLDFDILFTELVLILGTKIIDFHSVKKKLNLKIYLLGYQKNR